MHVTKIANRQLFFILFMIRTTIILAILPPVVTVYNAFQDAWASVIVSFHGLDTGDHHREAGTSFSGDDRYRVQSEIARHLARTGDLPRIPMGGFLDMASIDVRIYSEALIAGFLPESPPTFVVASMVIVAAVAAYHGLEAIGRAADLLFPFYLLMIVLSLTIPPSPPGNLPVS